MASCFSSTVSFATVASFRHFPTPYSSMFTIKPYKTPQHFTTNNQQITSLSIFSPQLTRRLFLPSVSGIWDAVTGGNSGREAIVAVRRGMLLFRQGDVSGSVAEFDKAMELDPRQKAYLWQRGLSLYYLDRFEDGAEQFRFDVAQNPNDTEESIWCFLCEAQLYGVDEARKRFLEVGKDPRPVMREAYVMFRDGGDPEKVSITNRQSSTFEYIDDFLCEEHYELRKIWVWFLEQLVAEFSNRENDFFYASLYAGLYYESEKKVDKAKFHILAASQSPYGKRSDDYMASLAQVHCQCRNWSST